METVIKYIEDLCVKITDGSHFSPEDDDKGQYPMYSVKDMEYNSFSNQNCKHIGQEIFDKLARADCRPLKDDIVIAKDGSYLKYVFKVKEDLDACILSSIAILRPDKKVIDPDYFVYLMRSSSVKNAMANYVSGSALPRIILGDFKKMKIAICSELKKQKQIASILAAYDSQIENNQRRIKNLENIAENLYKEWFVRFRFPGYDNAAFEGGVPRGWKIEKLGNVANICTGKCNREDAEEDGIYPLFDRSQEIKKSNSWLMDCEAIIVPGEGTSFIPRYYEGKFNLHQRCYCVEPKQEGTGMYLFYMLMFNRAYFLSVATGATVPSLRLNNFTKMKFTMPSLDLCIKFNKQISLLFKEINTLSKQIEDLTNQRDLLLLRLMSGKLEVTI